MKNIEFFPASDFTRDYISFPEPATTAIPEWYKEMPLRLGNDSKPGIFTRSIHPVANTTIKGCTPFLDALTTGYVYKNPVDIEVRRDSVTGDLSFRWMTPGDFMSEHTYNQISTVPAAFGGEQNVYKWNNNFVIKTPPGYSVLFTHPFNRNDLPFRTLTGVVDTDVYHLPVLFPFQFLDIPDGGDGPYIIPEGTPLCQFLPFKREDWESVKHEEVFNIEKKLFDFHKFIDRPYKYKYWNRKRYS
jgi:hypothetical protein